MQALLGQLECPSHHIHSTHTHTLFLWYTHPHTGNNQHILQLSHVCTAIRTLFGNFAVLLGNFKIQMALFLVVLQFYSAIFKFKWLFDHEKRYNWKNDDNIFFALIFKIERLLLIWNQTRIATLTFFTLRSSIFSP